MLITSDTINKQKHIREKDGGSDSKRRKENIFE
jgi:hypothetical protein